MRHFPGKLRAICLSLLAGLLVAAWPASAWAADLTIQNQMKISIYVESASLVRGRVIRDKPRYIEAGKDVTQEKVPPGPRVIYIFDANKPSRLLFQGKFPVLNSNLNITVVQVNTQGAPRARVVVGPR